MSEFLDGVTMDPSESAAQLERIGKTVLSKLGGYCKACGQQVEIGSPIERCLKWGWCHATCRRDAYRKAGGGL